MGRCRACGQGHWPRRGGRWPAGTARGHACVGRPGSASRQGGVGVAGCSSGRKSRVLSRPSRAERSAPAPRSPSRRGCDRLAAAGIDNRHRAGVHRRIPPGAGHHLPSEPESRWQSREWLARRRGSNQRGCAPRNRESPGDSAPASRWRRHRQSAVGVRRAADDRRQQNRQTGHR